jgi:hypothetical protein
VRALLTGPDVWSGTQMAKRDDWIEPLDHAEREALLAAVEGVRARGLDWLDVRRADFPLGPLAVRLARVAQALETGAGFVTLRNVPVDELGEDGARTALWGIGTHLGSAVSQSRYGELLGEVRDYGEQLGQATSRGYRTGASLRFHTDRCDLVALLCVRQCRQGGDSRLVSTPHLHNVLLQTDPAALELLYGDWYHSRQGEQQPCELRYYRNPIFAQHRGRFTSQYSRSYIESAQHFAEVPRVSAEQVRALDAVVAAADRECFETRMQPGDMQLLNNHVTWHARTELVDDAAAGRKRMLYRLWLASPLARELPDDFEELWGPTAAGAVRGGVVAAAGYRTADELHALRAGGDLPPRAGWPLEALPA